MLLLKKKKKVSLLVYMYAIVLQLINSFVSVRILFFLYPNFLTKDEFKNLFEQLQNFKKFKIDVEAESFNTIAFFEV